MDEEGDDTGVILILVILLLISDEFVSVNFWCPIDSANDVRECGVDNFGVKKDEYGSNNGVCKWVGVCVDDGWCE